MLQSMKKRLEEVISFLFHLTFHVKKNVLLQLQKNESLYEEI